MNKSHPIIVFLAIRAILFISLPFEGLVGYGDLLHFFGWVELDGWPFLDYWMEFPPLFAFLAEGLYRLTGGAVHSFANLLAVVFTLIQALNIHLFMRIANIVVPGSEEKRVWVYVALLTGLFYGWAYFDPLAVCALLAGIHWLLTDRSGRAAAAFSVGALIKWIPLLGLAAVWRVRPRTNLRWLIAGLGLILIAWGSLFWLSSEFTMASLQSQSAKGSWETIWALLDGNLATGNFGEKTLRYDPTTAAIPQGNPAKISSWLTIIPFALLGGWVFLTSRLEAPRSILAFIALTLCLFFLWSPGWSPQWTLYLLPFMLLLLRSRIVMLMSAVFVLVNLLEWPVLLSRGMFWGLYITVPIRTFLLLLLAWEFWLMIPRGKIQLMPMESS